MNIKSRRVEDIRNISSHTHTKTKHNIWNEIFPEHVTDEIVQRLMNRKTRQKKLGKIKHRA